MAGKAGNHGNERMLRCGMRILVVAVVLLVELAGVRAAPAAADECPGSHLKPSCHLDERAVCECSRRKDSSLVTCEWRCEAKR